MKRVKLIIRGRVQGVAYRAHTRRKALSLGLSGFVENRPDGSVYAEVEGPKETVDEMVRWCHHGPPLAEVASVEVSEGQPERRQGFEVRR